MFDPIELELRNHAAGLRRLAASLVGTEHADDVVQDAAVQAMQLREPPRSWHAMLRALVRNRAIDLRRALRRRSAYEADIADVDRHPPTDAVAAQREQLQRLHERLLALPEPYQSTLLSRYFRGLAIAEVARECDAPIATVKSRLQRGLQLLRGQCEHDLGPDWRASIVFAFGLPARSGIRAPLTAPLARLFLMTTTAKVFTATWAMLAVALFVFRTDLLPTPPDAGPASDATTGAPTGEVDSGAGRDEAMRHAALDSGTASQQPIGPRLIGRVVDRDAAPVVGAEVRLQASTSTPDVTRSGADGTFSLPLPPASNDAWNLAVAPPPNTSFCAWSLELQPSRDAMQLDDIVLRMGVRLRGVLLDHDGQPVAQTEVRVERQTFASDMHGRPEGTATVTTRVDGSFGPTAPLWPGPYHATSADVVLEGGEIAFALDLATEHGQVILRTASPSTVATIRGTVVASDGAAIAGALIRTRRMPRGHIVRTDALGSFEAPVLVADGSTLTINVWCDGYESQSSEPIEPGRQDVRVVLPFEGRLRVRAIAPDGSPVAQLHAALGTLRETRFWVRDQSPDVDEARGIVSMSRLHEGEHMLFVAPQDRWLAPRWQPLRIDEPRRDAQEVTVRLVPARTRQLRVEAADGTPAAGLVFELIAPFVPVLGEHDIVTDASNPRIRPGGDSGLLLQRGETAANGTATLRGPAGERLALRLSGRGIVPAIVQQLTLGETDELIVTCEQGTCWSGRLVPTSVAAVLAASGAGLHLRRDGRRLGPPGKRPTPLAADGAFSFGGLPPGDYELELDSHCIEGVIGGITLRSGQATVHDIDVRGLRQQELRLRLLIEGEPLRDTPVSVVGTHVVADRTISSFHTLHTDDDGVLRHLTTPGVLRLSVWRQDVENAAKELPLPEPIRVHADRDVDQVLDVRLVHRRFRVLVLTPDGTPAVGAYVSFSNGARATRGTAAATADDGTLMAPRVVRATYKVVVGFEDRAYDLGEMPITGEDLVLRLSPAQVR